MYIKSSFDHDPIALAKLAKQHNLYVNGWMMCEAYDYIIYHGSQNEIKIASLFDENDEPIATCIVDIDDSFHLQSFTKEMHRLKGYGRILVEFMKSQFPEAPMFGGFGIDGSNTFMSKCNIKIG